MPLQQRAYFADLMNSYRACISGVQLHGTVEIVNVNACDATNRLLHERVYASGVAPAHVLPVCVWLLLQLGENNTSACIA